MSTAPAVSAVPSQPSRVAANGLTHSTMTSKPSCSCSASECATAYPTGPSDGKAGPGNNRLLNAVNAYVRQSRASGQCYAMVDFPVGESANHYEH